MWTPTFAFRELHKLSLKAIAKGHAANPRLTFVFEDVRHFKAFQGFWKRYGVRRLPSTGFYMTTSALALCKKVHLFGFWPFANSTAGELLKVHYYNEEKFRVHDMLLEFRWLLSMHHFGLLQLHSGNCTNVG